MGLYPGCRVCAELFWIGFIEWGEEFEDGIGWGVAFGPAKASEFGFQVIGQDGAVGPNLFDEIGGDVVNETEGSADNFGLCHGLKNYGSRVV